MNIRKIPALILATALQILPMCRVACVNQAVAPTGFAIVLRWTAGALALLGSYHAVSGASATIPGVYTVTAITNGTQTGPVTTTPTGTNGQRLIYKAYVANSGTTPAGDVWSYDALPPGLTMNTNVGGADGNGAGIITGTPTQAGVYKTAIKAWNITTGPGLFATNLLTWTIYGGGAGSTPPNITGPPVSQIVAAGANVSFTVTSTGTAPLSYSWKFNGGPLAGATTSTLTITNVQAANQGDYTVVVSNAVGIATSPAAHLTVQQAPTGTLLANVHEVVGSVSFDVTGPAQTNYVIWSSTDLSHWTKIQTNFSATGTVHITNSINGAAVLFYRTSLSP